MVAWALSSEHLAPCLWGSYSFFNADFVGFCVEDFVEAGLRNFFMVSDFSDIRLSCVLTNAFAS
jgi:hypothetical protein